MKSTKRVRAWRKKNTLRYVWHNLKGNAKRRGKEFKLSFDEWKEFMSRTNYMEERGREAQSMSIDRIVNARGYELDNIRVIPVWENSLKADDDPIPF